MRQLTLKLLFFFSFKILYWPVLSSWSKCKQLEQNRKLYIRPGWSDCNRSLCSCVTKSSWKHFDFHLRRMISEHKFNHYLAPCPLTPKRHRPNTMCWALLVSESVICARGGIGSCGQIVAPWQMMSVCLWNCSQGCKTDPMSTQELEPIHCDTQQITVAQT